MYGKETLKLKDIRQMLQNNELMKKTDSTEETLGLVIKGKMGRSKSRGPKRDSDASNNNTCYHCRKSGHITKNCI